MIHEWILRVTTRGWRANAILVLGFISILGFFALMFRLESERVNDGVRVAYRSQYVYDVNVKDVIFSLLPPIFSVCPS
jgi:hypothetical protein